ncbi:cation-transporting P-type ATPase [Halorarum salinum]|uniref:Universal stress protein n=1 Tax=Halorarum salinum TaxID=2743089 RepID=A0A7D5LAG2_9EURY|nr:cation-transporting P-type ATPase [Halobaculum salinum]QLG61854.1 universal stress protein [Halobaculum salinum]
MAVPAAPDAVDWYAEGIDRIHDAFETDPDGLSTEEARSRLSEHGPNRLPRAKPVVWWTILLRQFKDPLIYVLVLAAVVSLAIGEGTDAAFIAAVLLVNAIVGRAQEWQAERSCRALQQLIRTRATVVRDGETRDVDLIVLGTRRRPAEYRSLLGSVTDRVIRLTDRPSLVVKTGVDE